MTLYLDDPFAIIGSDPDAPEPVKATTKRRLEDRRSSAASGKPGHCRSSREPDPFDVITGMEPKKDDDALEGPARRPVRPKPSGARRHEAKPSPATLREDAGVRVARLRSRFACDEPDPFDAITGKDPEEGTVRRTRTGRNARGRKVSRPARRIEKPSRSEGWIGVEKASSPARPWTPSRAPLRLGVHQDFEPAYSVLARLAARNAYPVQDFAGAFGIRVDAIVQGEASEVDLLASVAGIDATMLRSATPTRARHTVWALRGERFGDHLVDVGRSRACAACVAGDRIASRSDIGPVVRRRAWWDLAFVHRCPDHGLPLGSADVGRGEEAVDVHPSRDVDCSWETYVLGRLGFGPRNPADLLDRLDLSSAVELVATCATIAADGPNCRFRMVDAVREAETMTAGFALVRSGDMFEVFLEQLCLAHPHVEHGCLPADVFGAFHARFLSKPTRKHAPIVEAVKRFEVRRKLRLADRRGSSEAEVDSPAQARGENRFWRDAIELHIARIAADVPVLARPEWGTICLFAALRSTAAAPRIVEALLNGALRPRCRTKGEPSLRSVYVSKRDVTLLRPKRIRVESPLTADVFAKRLDIHPKTVRKLVQFGVVERSPKTHRGSYLIEEREFERFVDTYVSAMKLDTVLGMGAPVISRKLFRDHGIACAVPEEAGLVLFRRTDLMRAGLPAPGMGIRSA